MSNETHRHSDEVTKQESAPRLGRVKNPSASPVVGAFKPHPLKSPTMCSFDYQCRCWEHAGTDELLTALIDEIVE